MAAIRFQSDQEVMEAALREARKGIGSVEPNPAVGAIVVDDQLQQISTGHHQQFGYAHAEINAIRSAERTAGQQLFVTLEPCSHHGKTPPCADAVIAAGFRRVVIGCQDPAEHVAGQGIKRLRDAGIDVEVGVLNEPAKRLIAPFRKLQTNKQPWVHAKWAMTLDGRIATRTGHSQWISNQDSRSHVHRLRGRMDAIITGAGTVRHDNPTLTARPPGARTALRVVLCRTGTSVTCESQLVRTISEAPVLICVEKNRADEAHLQTLQSQGVEVMLAEGDASEVVTQLLDELGRRKVTNAMLEAGPGLLGTFFDGNQVDEVSVFIAPKIVGGVDSLSPIGGRGLEFIPSASSLTNLRVQHFQDDVLIQGDIEHA